MSTKTPLVAASILSCDFSKIGEEIAAVTAAGSDWIHVDVMDGHFVPNLTLGAPVVKSIKPVAKIPLDVHLMISEPGKYIKDFISAGSDYLTIHLESKGNIEQILQEIRSLDCKPGLSLKPKTAVEMLAPLLPLVDLVLVMTVEPGFGGQSFMQDQVAKITWLYEQRKKHGYKYLIEVDGGINAETVKQCAQADALVAGNFIFKNDYRKAIQILKGLT